MTTKRPTKKAPAEAGAIKLERWDPNDPMVKAVRRRRARIRAWAAKQDPDYLADVFAGTLIALLLERGLKRAREDFFQDALRQQWAKANKNRPKADPGAAARAEARALWPTAERRGWNATQFHTALVDRGHSIKHDTVRKWLTKLRQNGTC